MTRIVFLLLLFILTNCATNTKTPSEQINAYYEGFKNSDYTLVKNTLADSITTIEGDYITQFTPESYHEQFKWDSVFEPTYKLVKIDIEGTKPVATVSINSSKFEFLKNNPLTLKHRFSFDSGKITKVETIEFVDVNFDAWEKEKNALTSWIKVNHPELDGFINDLTMKGAQNYLKAITLYKKRANSPTAMWKAYVDANPQHANDDMPDADFFHSTKEEANRLGQLILKRQKKAGSSLYYMYEKYQANLPKVGKKQIVTDFDGNALAIIENVKVDTLPFHKVDAIYAALDMGTDMEPLKKWKSAHWDFFGNVLKADAKQPTEDMLVVQEWFEVVWP